MEPSQKQVGHSDGLREDFIAEVVEAVVE